ncbi:type VII secretion protein EssC [Neobacillus sp. MM2021_6]|uniref:type VII secretion protein EssC n=1 Tax=Bacillaceae TaxID=186817 RepID=UPI00140735F1|nr:MULTISPECIES: type VII secretion protein EssC [Bacillaceae]MBO0961677.1 type VII secretion protein EssC [Neobacillus sp. MM2021_6]NHC20557.1 type VII secretion protein EssC [Bacillus sp. MM2020_4]
MILTLFDRQKAFTFVLPERVTGRYVLTTENHDGVKREMMAIEAEEGQWFLKSNKSAQLHNAEGQKVSKQHIEPFSTYTIKRETATPSLLYVAPADPDQNIYTKHYTTTTKVKIGRSKDSQICFANKLVSSSHCEIDYRTSGGAVIRDLQSSNGTYVNGERVTEHTLEIGDVIYIMGLKIIFNGNLLSLNNPHQLVFLERNAFQPLKVEQPLPENEEELEEFLQEDETTDLFFRSPRFKRDITTTEIKIDPPPLPVNQEETPLMLLLGPSLTMGMASLFMGLFTLQNVLSTNGDIMMAMPTLVMSFSMLVGTILWPILQKRHEKKSRAKQENIRLEKYRAYLVEMAAVMEEEKKRQSEILHENHVPIGHCVARIQARQRNLWERSLGQDDFLKLRLGLGNLPLNAVIKFPEKRFSVADDELQGELQKLASAPKFLKEVPVTISLFEERISGIIGGRDKVMRFVEGLIFQLTSLHSYDELKMVFVYDGHEQDRWGFVKWLPHVWDDAKSIRYIATNANELKELSAVLEKEMAQRQAMADDELANGTQHYVIFSMDQNLAAKAEMFTMLLRSKKNIGFSLVALYDELKNLPKECSAVIELDDETAKVFDKDDITGQFTGFCPDIHLQDEPEKLAIQLSNISLASLNKAYSLPEMLTFLEMFGVSKIEHLNVLTKWKENDPVKTLEAPIGVDQAGELCKLDLHEKFHGPHGLIAGMTGSGKSEFIMTFILSLAVNYHPNEVAFILIDYKGGGMANAFVNLPHLAGTITNLDGAAVKRSLISIQSELKRRQSIFSETSKRVNESNIDIYKYQKLYREGRVTEPLQHLFIISDEFAELKTQQPEFMDQLVSAARIGRSLGIHLILATQKPSGVVDDQIWSNSKFRISLKVQEKADSMEVIKRPDAAELSTTGRFYLQVGFNEVFMLGQSAWGGAPYYPAEKMKKHVDDSIVVIDHLGRVLKSARMDKRKTLVKNPPKQLDEITNYLAHLASQEEIKVKQLWLEPIPSEIFLGKLHEKYRVTVERSHLLHPVIGEYDDPATQSQHILRLPITTEGNTVLYGVAGSGKTTFLATMIYSLMEEHTPEEVNLYLLDFSSETLSRFSEAPHVGDVVLSYESEKITNLFRMLTTEIERRKKCFAKYGGDFGTYNRLANQPLASIVVVIHNYAAFSEMYEDYEESISFLTREGLKYGIYFVVTAANTGAIRYRLLQNFKQLFVLQLNDTTEYSGVLGSVDGVYPSKHKGRGIFKTDGVYEFQTALITDVTTDMYRFMTNYCVEQNKKWQKARARRIPILPEKVDRDYLAAGEFQSKQPGTIPVAVEKNALAISYFDFTESFVNLVLTGTNDEECTDFIQGSAEMLAASGGSEVIAIDPHNSFRRDANRSYRYVTGGQAIEETVVYLFNTLVYRHNTTKDALAEGVMPPVFAPIFCVMDSFIDMNNALSADGKDKLSVFLDKGSSLAVHLIISDQADRINTISYEGWFKNHVSQCDGIWVGGGITNQFVLKTNKTTSDMYQEMPAGFGYVIKKGKPVLVKLLSSAAVNEEEVVYG